MEPKPPPAKPARKGLPVVVIVILVIGGLTLATCIGGAGIGAYWVLSRGDQIATETVIGPASTGVVHLNDTTDDVGMRLLGTHVLQALQRLQNAGADAALPPWLQGFRGDTTAQTQQVVSLLWPREATMSFEPDVEHGGELTVGAVNLAHFAGPLRLFFDADSAERTATSYHGVTLYEANDGTASLRLGTTLVFGSQTPLVTAVIDRGEAGSAASAELAALLERVKPSADVYLGFAAGSGHARDLSGLEGAPVALGIDVQTADLLAVRLLVVGAAGAAESVRAAFVAEVTRMAGGASLTIAVTPRLEGNDLWLEGTITGTAELVRTAATAMQLGAEAARQQQAAD